jgi:hypothetical protein
MALSINGIFHSFATAEIDIAGKKFYGFQSLNWKEDLKKEPVKGQGVVGLGFTLGDYEASADMEILLSEWTRLLAVIGDGYGYKPFNLGCQYRAPGKPLISVDIKQATINGHEISNSRGPAGTTVKVPLMVIQPIVTNGLTAIDRARLGIPNLG